MQHFDWYKALKGAKVVTRMGKRVEIEKEWHLDTSFPISGLVERGDGTKEPMTWTSSGTATFFKRTDPYDLFLEDENETNLNVK